MKDFSSLEPIKSRRPPADNDHKQNPGLSEEGGWNDGRGGKIRRVNKCVNGPRAASYLWFDASSLGGYILRLTWSAQPISGLKATGHTCDIAWQRAKEGDLGRARGMPPSPAGIPGGIAEKHPFYIPSLFLIITPVFSAYPGTENVLFSGETIYVGPLGYPIKKKSYKSITLDRLSVGVKEDSFYRVHWLARDAR